MSPFEEIELLIKKISESVETIETTDIEYFEAERMIFLAEKCENLSRIAYRAASYINEKGNN